MALTRPNLENILTNAAFFTDALTVLNAGSTAANLDVGFVMNRANGLVNNAAFYWSESLQSFVVAITPTSGIAVSNVSVSSYANITAGIVSAANISTSTITATTYYYPNGQQVGAGSAVNLNIYLNKATATNTTNTLIDSVSTTGNSAVNWTITAIDNIKSNVKMSTINAMTDGVSVFYNEYGTMVSNVNANVATFFSNLYNGTISLWALGGTSNVTVAVERQSVGAGQTVGFLNSVGPVGATGAQGPAGTVANTSSWVVTTNLTPATSTTTGALQVSGGAGIGGNLYVGGYSNYYIATGNISNTSALTITGNVYGRGGLGYLDAIQLTNSYSGATNPTKYLRLNSIGGLEIVNSAYTTTIFTLTDAGALTVPGPFYINGLQAVNGPAFSAYLLTGQSFNSGAGGNVIYNGKLYDTTNSYNTNTGVFKPNVAGYYQFNWTAGANSYTTSSGIVMSTLYKNTTEIARGARLVANTGGMVSHGSTTCYLNGTTDGVVVYFLQASGGAATLEADAGAVTNGGSYCNFFSGVMVRGA